MDTCRRYYFLIAILLCSVCAQAQQHGIIASSIQIGGGSFTGILDDIPSASFAISVRRLNGAYTGAAMRIVRASDSGETDINFDGSGDLDVASIASYCSGTTCYVGIWYDQSGNGRNAYGKDYGVDENSLPIIYESGAVTTLNSIAAPRFEHPRAFDWTDTGSQITDFISTGPAAGDKAVTVSTVFEQGSAATSPWKLLIEDNVSSTYILQTYDDSGTERIDFGQFGNTYGVGLTDDAQIHTVDQFNGNNFALYENGTSVGSGSIGGVVNPGSITGVRVRIGGGSFSSRNLTGYMQEMIVWKTVESSSAIFTDIDTYYSIP